jgi:hypothetical protein
LDHIPIVDRVTLLDIDQTNQGPSSRPVVAVEKEDRQLSKTVSQRITNCLKHWRIIPNRFLAAKVAFSLGREKPPSVYTSSKVARLR